MSKKRIMIVEDEWIIAEDIQKCLNKLGYAVSTIESFGEKAVQKAEEDKPDLILMDIVLKGEMDGIEAARQIYTRFGIPIVFLTSSYTGSKALERAKTSEPFGYLLKPFRESALHSTIEIALYKHSAEQKLKILNETLELRVEERTRELSDRSLLAELSAEVGLTVIQKGAIPDILQKCTEALVRHLNVAFARIWLFNEEKNILELQSSAGIYTHTDGEHKSIPMGKYKIGLIALERKPHLTNSVIGDPEIHNQEWAKRMGLISFAGYPIVIGEHLIGVMGMFAQKPLTDITLKALESIADTIALGIERKQIEEEHEKTKELLYHAQKIESIGRLAGGVAHDFNNVLMAIIGYADLIRTTIKEDDPIQNFTEKIQASAQKATRLTQSLLAFSRKQPITLEPVNINTIIKNLDTLSHGLLNESIEYKLSLTERDHLVMAGVDLIEQVIMNLATNARDAMPDGGIFTISTDIVDLDTECAKRYGLAKTGEHVVLKISDTGVGMDEETKGKVLEPFFTTKAKGKGTGLGLSIACGIIKQHNGHLQILSKPGKGTTVEIYLPLADASEKQKDIKKTPGTAVPSVRASETILLAEDDEDVRFVLAKIFERKGYRVIAVANGDEAIHRYKEMKDDIHILVSDVMMPTKNGMQAYNTIMEIRPNLKVLFLSGYSDEEALNSKILAEGLSYLQKPVTQEVLLKKVREILDS
ncbi:MAG: sensor histidine kinase response regulator [Candidatus Brocadiaceae bacterium]|nr:sensor histidine kinase response regulator [Candidatus Brocadiaceae bacterium]